MFVLLLVDNFLCKKQAPAGFFFLRERPLGPLEPFLILTPDHCPRQSNGAQILPPEKWEFLACHLGGFWCFSGNKLASPGRTVQVATSLPCPLEAVFPELTQRKELLSFVTQLLLTCLVYLGLAKSCFVTRLQNRTSITCCLMAGLQGSNK